MTISLTHTHTRKEKNLHSVQLLLLVALWLWRLYKRPWAVKLCQHPPLVAICMCALMSECINTNSLFRLQGPTALLTLKLVWLFFFFKVDPPKTSYCLINPFVLWRNTSGSFCVATIVFMFFCILAVTLWKYLCWHLDQWGNCSEQVWRSNYCELLDKKKKHLGKTPEASVPTELLYLLKVITGAMRTHTHTLGRSLETMKHTGVGGAGSHTVQ